MYFKTFCKSFPFLPLLILNISLHQKNTRIHCTKLQNPYPTKLVQDIKVIPPNLDYEKEEPLDNLKVTLSLK